MKRLLIPLLAVIALPTDINTETWYLLGKGNSGTDFTIEMQSKEGSFRAVTKIY